MKCYLDSKDTGTIPRHVANTKNGILSMAIQTITVRLGSKLYELNTFAWQFGRPMLELTGLSVLSTRSLLRIVRIVSSIDNIVPIIVWYCFSIVLVLYLYCLGQTILFNLLSVLYILLKFIVNIIVCLI